MTAADYLMLISMVCIWALMAINVFLSVGGFLYYHQCSKTDGHVPIDEYPFVSIMVPAHNESVVIRRTVRALLNFDYPHDRYESSSSTTTPLMTPQMCSSRFRRRIPAAT